MAAQHKKRTRVDRQADDAPFLTLRVRGSGVRSGRISVPDLIEICQEAQNAVRRQAEALKSFPGPTAQSAEGEYTLELVGIGKAGTTLEFGLSKPQRPLPFDDFGVFGHRVIEELASAIRSLGNGDNNVIDGGVLRSLDSLVATMDRHRISEIDWIAPKRGKNPRIAAPINKTVRARIASRLSLPRRAIMTRKGTFFSDTSIFELARNQKVDPVLDVETLCGGFPPEEDIDEFLREIYDARS